MRVVELLQGVRIHQGVSHRVGQNGQVEGSTVIRQETATLEFHSRDDHNDALGQADGIFISGQPISLEEVTETVVPKRRDIHKHNSSDWSRYKSRRRD